MKIIKLGFLFLATLLRRKIKYLLAFLVALFVAASVIYFFKDELFRPSISEGIVGTFTERDIPEIVTHLLSTGLVAVDQSGKPKGNLVEGWQINNDATQYTFKLKDNLYWSDGTRLEAHDLDLTLPDVETRVLDGKTIEFKLGGSFSPFPALLNKPVLKKGTLLGTGPYFVDQIKLDQIFIKKLVLKSQDKSLPQVVIRFYPNEKIAKNALALGEVQSILGINDKGGLLKQKTLSFADKTNYRQLVMIFYNTKDPILSDENFRLALSYAAPVIADGIPARTSIPPASWAYNNETKIFLGNPEQAKKYLAKVKNGKDSTITLTATSFLKEAGERVIEGWSKAGVKVVLRVESGIPQNFQALLITQNIPQDPDQYSLWHSTQVHTNVSKISSPRLDKDLEDGRKLMDNEARKARYLDFQKVLLDRSPATFLYFPKFQVVYRTKIEANLKKVLELQLANL